MSGKSKHTNPLEPLIAEAVAILVADLAQENGWHVAAVKKILSDFGGAPTSIHIAKSDLDNAEFEADYGTIKKLLESRKPINAFHMWGFFLYFRENEDINPRLERYILETKLKHKLELVKSFNKFFGVHGEIDMDLCSALKGYYEMFRPSYLRPKEEIMVSRFDVGMDDDPLSCKLRNEFTDRFGRSRSEDFFGEMIPYGPRMMAILRAEGKKSAAIIMHFDALDDNFADGATGGDMRGIILSAIGHSQGSAWPFYAHKVEEDAKPRVIGIADFGKLPEDVQESLNRGAVHWEPKNYPSPYLR